MLVLVVSFPVITDNPVCVRGGIRLLLCTGDVTTQVIVQPLEKTFAQIHVSNRIDALRELNRARDLSISIAPVVLNAL